MGRESVTICHCGASFDPSRTYEDRVRTHGPRRKFCTLRCAKARDNKEKKRARKRLLWTRYGLTLEAYEALWTQQEGLCAICGQTDKTWNTLHDVQFSLNVDHDHATGEVRGLLCTPCNRGIGFLRDNAELLKKATAYLERSR